MIKTALVIVALSIIAPACAKAPSSLSPAGVRIWQADQAVVALGDVQHVAIALNGVQVCDPAPCHPLLSDANTRIVINTVEAGVKTIHEVPSGWKATALAALTQLSTTLDAAGKAKLAAYVDAARAILNGVN